MTSKVVFVTVGTTEFEELIRTVTQPVILKALKERGYSKIVMQIGNGKYVPTSDIIEIESFRLKPSLLEDFQRADLVISHAGAGTCLEVLSMGKPLIVVINELLMDNHQSELAQALHDRGYAAATNSTDLLSTIQNLDVTSLRPYPKADRSRFATYLNTIMDND